MYNRDILTVNAVSQEPIICWEPTVAGNTLHKRAHVALFLSLELQLVLRFQQLLDSPTIIEVHH